MSAPDRRFKSRTPEDTTIAWPTRKPLTRTCSPGRQSRRPRGKVQRQAVGVGSEKVEIAAARRAILDQDLQRSSSSTGASMPPCPLARAGARASIDSRRSAGVEEAARAAPPERRNETAAREREARPYGAREREETGSAEKWGSPK